MAKIRNIYCCKDLSDFCYVSSTYNDAGCRKGFRKKRCRFGGMQSHVYFIFPNRKR